MQKYSDIVLVVNVPGGQARAPAAATVQVNVSGGGIATIYSDNGVTTQANPITADSTGEYSFYAADGAYDLIVAVPGFTTETKTAAVLLNSGSAGSVLTSLAASSGSSLVGFLQSGSGAVAETVESALRDLRAGISTDTIYSRFYRADTTFNGTVNHGTMFGYNVSGFGATPPDITKPSILIAMESDYNDGAIHHLEFHLNMGGPNISYSRPISVDYHLTGAMANKAGNS